MIYKTYSKDEYHTKGGLFDQEMKGLSKNWDTVGITHHVDDIESFLVLAIYKGMVVGEDWVLDNAAAQAWKSAFSQGVEFMEGYIVDSLEKFWE